MKTTHKIIIAILTITTISSLLFAIVQGETAVRHAEMAIAAQELAEEQRDRAIQAEVFAKHAAKEAQQSVERATMELLECQNKLVIK